MKKLLLISTLMLLPALGFAALKSETVEYKHGEVACEGYMVYDDAVSSRRPGIIVVHDWKGLGPNSKMRADLLARMGYTVFAIDMYGKGVRPKDHEEAAKVSGVYRSDRGLMRRRAAAGLEVLKKHFSVDTSKIAAIGYCFGGTTVLEMARNGENLLGVASFHGGLDTPTKDKNFKGKVIAFHGADDKFVAPEAVKGFEDEMRAAKADWQIVKYGGAVHGFTIKENGNDPSSGQAYNEAADRRSWESLKLFLNEIFKK